MATILEVEGYRVETFQERCHRQKEGRPDDEVRIVRKSDGAYVTILPEHALGILWECAHGVSEVETLEWVKGLIADHEKAAKLDWGGPYWLPSTAVAGITPAVEG